MHLIGFPASGKLTIARELAEMASRTGHRCVVLDNHHTNNVIFAALDLDGVKPAPPTIDTAANRPTDAAQLILQRLENGNA